MNLSYMSVGKKSFIEICSSPSSSSKVSSAEKSAPLDHGFGSSTSVATKNKPVTPIKISDKLNYNKAFDMSQIFAKKSIMETIINDQKNRDNSIREKRSVSKTTPQKPKPFSKEDKAKENPIINAPPKTINKTGDYKSDLKKACDELEKTRNLALEQIQIAKNISNDNENSIFEQKSFFISSMRDLQERNQKLLRENIMLKEIQFELEKSAEKITLFKSGKKDLTICSYIYDSWKNRESKAELYTKYTDKVQQYDELMNKYQELEEQFFNYISKHKENNQDDPFQGKKKGKKLKNSKDSTSQFENEYNGQRLTKKLLMNLENGTYSQNTPNAFRQKIIELDDDSKSDISFKILRETVDHNNNRGKYKTSKPPTPIKGSKTPTKAQSKGNVKDEKQQENRFSTKQNTQGNKSYLQMNREISKQDGGDSDLDDNKSVISNNGKKDAKKKKIITKEQKKYLSEQQDTAFNSIADTLFNF